MTTSFAANYDREFKEDKEDEKPKTPARYMPSFILGSDIECAAAVAEATVASESCRAKHILGIIQAQQNEHAKMVRQIADSIRPVWH